MYIKQINLPGTKLQFFRYYKVVFNGLNCVYGPAIGYTQFIKWETLINELNDFNLISGHKNAKWEVLTKEEFFLEMI